MSKWLHRIIVEGILDNPIAPKLNVFQKFLKISANLPLVRTLWIGSWLRKKIPYPASCLDYNVGYDFMVMRESKGVSDISPQGFPDYSKSHFIKKSCRVGTPEQIVQWLANSKELEKSLPCVVTCTK
jgi:hypothetical protein